RTTFRSCQANTISSLAVSGCTRSTIKFSVDSFRGVTFSTASPDSCVTPRRRPRAVSGRVPSDVPTAPMLRPQQHVQPERQRPAARCCCFCRAPAELDQRLMQPELRRSRMKTLPYLRRTGGRYVRTFRSTLAFVGKLKSFPTQLSRHRKSVLRASYGIFYGRQNMLSQVGSITTNGVQQQTIFLNTPIISSGVPGPVWPNLVTPAAGTCTSGGRTNPFPCFSGVRVFSRNYENPRIYTTNVQFEQEVMRDLSIYF